MLRSVVGSRRRKILTAASALLIATLYGMYLLHGFAVKAMAAQSPKAQLAPYLLGQMKSPSPIGAQGQLQSALRAQPLAQQLVNIAVYNGFVESGGKLPPESSIRLLKSMGWRNTPSLLNIMTAAALRNDLETAIDSIDALMRRGKARDQATALMNMVELDPQTRPLVLARLTENPGWRAEYLRNTDYLKTPQQLSVRADVALELSRRGLTLRRDEIAPIALALLRANRSREAYRLWLHYRRQPPMLINDPELNWAFLARTADAGDMPFEWYPHSGSGHWVEFARQNGDAVAVVHWNGSDEPDLLSQRLSLTPGRYDLLVSIAAPSGRSRMELGFLLRCGTETVKFDEVVARTGAVTRLRADAPISCPDPTMVVAGRNRATSGDSARALGGAEPVEFVISRIVLQPASR
jgi:hypothetical protein